MNTLDRKTIVVVIVGAIILVGAIAYSLITLLGTNEAAPTATAPQGVEAPPTETPALSQTPTAELPTPLVSSPILTETERIPLDIQRYSAEIGQRAQGVAESLLALGTLMQNARVGDRNWTIAVGAHIARIRLTHKEFSEMTPPADMVEFHQAFVEATGECDASMDLLVSGVDNQSIDDLNAGAELMQSCSEKLRQATEALNAYLQAFE